MTNTTTQTFSERYASEMPLRQEACKKYYENKLKAQSAEDCKKYWRQFKSNKGNWICLVKMPNGTQFYTVTSFQYEWVRAGDNYGMWNELFLIEKFNK